MNRQLFCSLAVLLFFQVLQAQVKDTMAVFFNSQLEPVKKKQGVFVGAAVRRTDGWQVVVYTDSLKLLMRGAYTDHTCKVKNGPFVYYNGKDQRLIAGTWVMNQRNGLWKTWHSNGNTKDSVLFSNNLLDGAAYSLYPTGQMESSGWYNKGSIDSVWIWYHENGRRATVEWYRGAKLADLQCFDSLGNSTGASCAVTREPAIKGHYGGITKYLSDSIKLPERIPESEQGFVRIRFSVRKDGTATEPEVLSPVGKSFREEILRAFKSIPGWYPAISHNRIVDHVYDFNIPYFPRGRYIPQDGFPPAPIPEPTEF